MLNQELKIEEEKLRKRHKESVKQKRGQWTPELSEEIDSLEKKIFELNCKRFNKLPY